MLSRTWISLPYWFYVIYSFIAMATILFKSDTLGYLLWIIYCHLYHVYIHFKLHSFHLISQRQPYNCKNQWTLLSLDFSGPLIVAMFNLDLFSSHTACNSQTIPSKQKASTLTHVWQFSNQSQQPSSLT